MASNNSEMNIPTLQEAEAYLSEAETMNPGPWVQHSKVVAQAAEAIATFHPQLKPHVAYVLGLLHDIGRRKGVTKMRHVLDGYLFLEAKGFTDAAQICMTHSFPIKKADAIFGTWDCSPKELSFIRKYLDQAEYTDYDRLIQLCDSLALPSGYCLIEKRMVDVALRYGFNEYTCSKWEATLQLQETFEAEIGRSIYDVLPGVVENTFRSK